MLTMMELIYPFGDSAQSINFLYGLLDASLKSIVILAAAGVLLLVSRRASAAFRHLVWFTVIVSLICLPMLSVLLPGRQLPILLRVLPTADGMELKKEVAQSQPPERVPTGWHSTQPSTQPLSSPTPFQPQSQSEVNAPKYSAKAIASLHWSAWILLIWFVGALIVLVPLLIGMVGIRRLAQHSQQITDGPLAFVMHSLSRKLGLKRRVTLLLPTTGNALTMPMSWGIVRPVVLLPADAENWSADKKSVVLLHELSHVQRWDWLTQAFAQLACAMYWFNPLTWLAASRLRIERERACDNRVLAAGFKASDYADHLLEIARALCSKTSALLPVVTMARLSNLERRLRVILDGNQNRRPMTPRRVIFGLLLIACIVLPLGAVPLTSCQIGRYEAKCRLLVKPPGAKLIEDGLWVNFGEPYPVGHINLAEHVELLKSNRLLQKVVDLLNSTHSLNLSLKQVKKAISVKPIRDTDVMEVSAIHRDKQTAILLANTSAEVYISEIEKKRRAAMEKSMEFLSQQMEEIGKDLEYATVKLASEKEQQELMQGKKQSVSILRLEQHCRVLEKLYSSLLEKHEEIELLMNQPMFHLWDKAQ